MSIPLSICVLVKAHKDEEAFKKLVEWLKYNTAFGSCLWMPCEHEEKCRLGEEEVKELFGRLEEEMLKGRGKG